jgi:hypothetical protein
MKSCRFWPRSIQASISKNRITLDFPAPLAPINTVSCGSASSSTAARLRKPLMLTRRI